MSNQLAGKKVLFITSNTGIERDELVKPLETLKAHGALVAHGSSDGGTTQTFVQDTEKDRTVESQVALAGLDASDFDALVIPGGTVNADTLRLDENAQRLAKEFAESGKVIAAICHGPWLLINAGVIAGKTLTSYPSVRLDLENAGAAGWIDVEVKQCQANGWTLITSRNPNDIPVFNDAIVAALK
ncbi:MULTISPECIES: type 1 glutamine amidotransferase domain-containing protein [Gammaproteobacteria]|jgi:protease I|uniref:Glutamine amidotransferase n=1 Tax=Stutzerimonas stutzeri TaxID=316 RepID=A0A0D7E701_STUST|nr:MULTISPECIES: type 1 glutamine amidotransferase domain-containing protein [Gammaproteobacteria]KFJ93081.1 glutamine amidotransferase [Pseudomonas sp. 1-7]HCG40427.1 type 1 glutamine amidotransferase [Pseudomonas sp.]KIZ35292.1 glutamine amidotransferase [Stutzerimonas stutzeri]MBA1240367.1 type 1 glutamine amidotransferase [Stutzerimonas kunmingensis]MCQ4254691.1 type 1 glutamine amidotransferase [Stutzerimonas stutzeri]